MATRPRVKVRTGCITCKKAGNLTTETTKNTGGIKRDKTSLRTSNIKNTKTRIKTSNTKTSTTGISGTRTAFNIDNSLSTSNSLVSNDNVLSNTLVSNTLSSEEHHWLHHFSNYTAPALSGHTNSLSFWSIEIVQLSTVEPAIRHAMVAVSSCHARFETLQLQQYQHDNDNKQRQYCIDHNNDNNDKKVKVVGQDFSIRHYSLAIARLRKMLDDLQTTKTEVPLICCLLFICLECLYGNTALTLTHLRNGLKILDSRLWFLEANSSTNRTLKSMKENLKAIFERLKAQCTVFGISGSAPTATKVPESMDFRDVVGAEARLGVLISSSMSFAKEMRNHYGQRQQDNDESYKKTLQKQLLDQLLEWETQMRSLEQHDSLQERIDSDDTAVLLLKIRHQATFVFLAISLDPQQTFCDAFLPRFKTMIDLVERYMAPTSTTKNNSNNSGAASNSATPSLLSSAFSLESATIPALWMTAIRCRDPTTRHRAIKLLDMHPSREVLWDPRLHGKAAKRIVEIEEASLLPLHQPVQQEHQQQSYSGNQWPDERSRVYRTDVHRTSEEPTRSASLVFHTAPNGYFGDKVIWSEDIIF